MSEIDAMKAIEDSFAEIDELAQKRVLDWAFSRYLNIVPPNPSAQAAAAPTTGGASNAPTKKKTKKPKNTPKQIKDLNLSPGGKTSGGDFAKTKSPTNAKEKCVVAIFYCRETLELPAVTADHVFTFFKNASWPVPSDLINTLAQAGSAGWLDTSNAANLLITPIGENLVEHTLPKSKK